MNPYISYIERIPHMTTLGRLYALHLALGASDEGWVTTTVQAEMKWCDCTELQIQQIIFELEREEIARAYVQPCPLGDNQEIVWRLFLPDQPFEHREDAPRGQRDRVLSKTGYQCFYCGVEDDNHLQLDHMHPASRGGSNDDENLVGACPSCNAQKRDRTVDEYRAYLTHKRKVEQLVFHGEQVLDQ